MKAKYLFIFLISLFALIQPVEAGLVTSLIKVANKAKTAKSLTRMTSIPHINPTYTAGSVVAAKAVNKATQKYDNLEKQEYAGTVEYAGTAPTKVQWSGNPEDILVKMEQKYSGASLSLIKACIEINEKQVLSYLQEGLILDTQLTEDVLTYACSYGWDEVINTILQQGGKVENQQLPLCFLALYTCEIDTVIALMDAGCSLYYYSPSDPTEVDSTLLIKACGLDSIKLVHAILARKSEDDDFMMLSSEGAGYFLCLGQSNALEIAKTLIETDIDINTPDLDGMNALSFIALSPNTRLTVEQYRQAAKEGIQERMEEFRILLSSSAINLELLQKKIELLAIEQFQTVVPIEKTLLAVEFLLQHGADINHQDDDDYTALMYAAEGGNSELVHFLLERGAELDIQNQERETALILAVQQNHVDVVRLLLQAGADIYRCNEHQKMALDYALELPDDQCRTLIEKIDEKVQKEKKNRIIGALVMLGAGLGLVYLLYFRKSKKSVQEKTSCLFGIFRAFVLLTSLKLIIGGIFLLVDAIKKFF